MIVYVMCFNILAVMVTVSRILCRCTCMAIAIACVYMRLYIYLYTCTIVKQISSIIKSPIAQFLFKMLWLFCSNQL